MSCSNVLFSIVLIMAAALVPDKKSEPGPAAAAPNSAGRSTSSPT